MAYPPQSGVPYTIIGGFPESGDRRTNLVPSPRAARGMAGWSNTPGLINAGSKMTVEYDSAFGKAGEVFQVRTDGTATLQGYYSSPIALTGSVTHTAKISAKRMQGTGALRLWVILAVSPFTSYSIPGADVTPAAWTDYSLSFTPAVSGAYLVLVEVPTATATTFRFSDVLVSPGTVGTFFDGDMPGYKWTGTAGNSASTQAGTRAVVNDQADADYTGMLEGDDAVTGTDSAEIRENADELTEADGGVHGSFYRGRRPVTIKGKVTPISSAADRALKGGRLLRAGGGALRQMNPLDPTNGDLVMRWQPSGAPEDMFLKARTQVPARLTGAWIKDFFVGVVAADPRIYGIGTQKAILYAGGGPAYTDDFSFNTVGDYTLLGGTPPTISGGLMNATAGGASLSWNGVPGYGPTYGDVLVTVQGRSQSGQSYYATPFVRGLNSNNRIWAAPEGANLKIYKLDNGANTSLATSAMTGWPTAVTGTPVWVSLQAVGNVLTAKAYLSNPFTGGAPVTGGTATATLAGADATKFGAGITGSVGHAGWSPGGALTETWDDWTVQPFAPGTTPAVSYDRSMAVNSNFGSQVAQAFVSHAGDAVAPVVGTVYGPASNFAIQNATTGEELSFTVALLAGEKLEVDTLSGVITYITTGGVRSVHGDLLSVSRSRYWGLVPNVPNDIRLVVNAGAVNGTTKLELAYRNTWL